MLCIGFTPPHQCTGTAMMLIRKTGRRPCFILLCLFAAVSVPLWKLMSRIRTATQPLPFTPAWTAPSSVRCRDQLDDSVAAQVLSKELVIRRVYFDPRGRDHHHNATVFLLEAEGAKLTKERFSGCRAGQYTSKKINLRTKKKIRTSSLALVDCYNIPGVKNGDSAFLLYKRNSTQPPVEISSLKPLFLPEPRPAHKPPSATVVMCVGMIRSGVHTPSEHGMLYHWLTYHKVVGVDHVHMFTKNNFVRDGGLENEVVKQALKEGFLSIDFWANWVNSEDVNNSQILAYQDCLYRFQGVYDYVMYADTDDFFVPVKNPSIKHYLKTWCSGKTSTCRFKWREYYPVCGWDPNLIAPNGSLTGAVTYKRTIDREMPKSAHQLKALLNTGLHTPKDVLDGYKMPRHSISSKEAYVAHIRFGRRPEGGC